MNRKLSDNIKGKDRSNFECFKTTTECKMGSVRCNLWNMCSLKYEYAAEVWQDIPAYLSDAIESIQKRALKIIFSNFSYEQALDQAKLSLLVDRRIFVCKKLMAEMRNEDHRISFFSSTSYEKFYTISVKIRKYQSHNNNEKNKKSKWLFYF